METTYLTQTGRIFDIQRFSIHDGPGIRTLIFLKGCIFRCKWCCNPESQDFEIETMRFDGKNKCIGREVTVEEVIQDIERDRNYYMRSGGGITLSGGECLCQPEFAKALLHACKERGISTAIETTAGVKPQIVEDILPVVDVVMMDIKHMNASKHKQYTGRDNIQILDNAKLIARSGVELIIRVPVIPGVNDTVCEIGEIAKFTKSLETVQSIHLLPYHRMGVDKYDGLGRDYELAMAQAPSIDTMEQLLEVVKSYGLEGQIGG